MVATARQMGVDPALAQAVAYQESGFNQAAVSPANVIGTTQVIPSSGDWASAITGRERGTHPNTRRYVANVRTLMSRFA